jgi:hypothetical protein
VCVGTLRAPRATHHRDYTADLTLGSGKVLAGKGAQKAPLGPLPLVYGGAIPASGVDAAEAALCGPVSLDPDAAAGKIVVSVCARVCVSLGCVRGWLAVAGTSTRQRKHPTHTHTHNRTQPRAQICDRGDYTIDTKAGEVLAAGGSGMVLVNVPEGRTNLFATNFAVPYVHLEALHRDEVVAYAAAAGATATLGVQVILFNATAPAMAEFSSRGPAIASRGLVLKPDITAPGVPCCVARGLCVRGGGGGGVWVGGCISGTWRSAGACLSPCHCMAAPRHQQPHTLRTLDARRRRHPRGVHRKRHH